MTCKDCPPIPASGPKDEQNTARTYWVDPQLGLAPALTQLRVVLTRIEGVPQMAVDGTITANSHPPINGYQDQGDKHVPLWPECSKRRHAVTVRSNKTIDIAVQCKHPESPLFAKAPTCQQCLDCPLK